MLSNNVNRDSSKLFCRVSFKKFHQGYFHASDVVLWKLRITPNFSMQILQKISLNLPRIFVRIVSGNPSEFFSAVIISGLLQYFTMNYHQIFSVISPVSSFLGISPRICPVNLACQYNIYSSYFSRESSKSFQGIVRAGVRKLFFLKILQRKVRENLHKFLQLP